MIPSSVLITRHDKIGDFILALPLCKAIKEQYPDVQICMLVAPVTYALAREISFIDHVISYRKEATNEVLAEMRRLAPEVSISCFIDTRLGWLLKRAGIPKRIAPATKLAQFFFNVRISQRRSRVEKPEFVYNLELGRVLFPNLRLEYGQPLLDFQTRQSEQKKIVAFHPGFGGSSDGNLSLSDYLRLARRAAGMPNIEVIFTFGPDDQEARQGVEDALDFPAQLMDQFSSLRGFCEFLQGCTLFVSTSTGPMHLAAAVNTPTLSFFGNSLFASSKRWQPVSAPSLQHNFMLDSERSSDQFKEIEQTMIGLLQ